MCDAGGKGTPCGIGAWGMRGFQASALSHGAPPADGFCFFVPASLSFPAAIAVTSAMGLQVRVVQVERLCFTFFGGSDMEGRRFVPKPECSTGSSFISILLFPFTLDAVKGAECTVSQSAAGVVERIFGVLLYGAWRWWCWWFELFLLLPNVAFIHVYERLSLKARYYFSAMLYTCVVKWNC